MQVKIRQQSWRNYTSKHSVFLQSKKSLDDIWKAQPEVQHCSPGNDMLTDAANLEIAHAAFQLAEAAIHDVATEESSYQQFYLTTACLVADAFSTAEDPALRLARFSALQDTLEGKGITLIAEIVIPRIQ